MKKNDKGILFSSLTKGERFWLNRRRLNITQARAAKNFGVTEDRITAWENGRDLERCPAVLLAPRSLTTGEQLTLARRRKGWSLHQTARKMGVSHVTLIKWEDDRNSTQAEALSWWAGQGWPEQAAA